MSAGGCVDEEDVVVDLRVALEEIAQGGLAGGGPSEALGRQDLCPQPEPEFRQHTDELRARTVAFTHQFLVGEIADPSWARWASALLPAVVIEAVIAWLDAGQPDRAAAAAKIRRIVEGVLDAARSSS